MTLETRLVSEKNVQKWINKTLSAYFWYFACQYKETRAKKQSINLIDNNQDKNW